MERTETLYNVMVREARDRAASAVQDLSKGVVPVVLVMALLAPTWYLRGKLSDVENQLQTSAAATVELTAKLKELTPLVRDVALAQARIETQEKSLGIAERDRALLDARLRDLEERMQRVELRDER